MSYPYLRSSCSWSVDGCFGGVIDGSVRLLVRKENIIQDLNAYLASDLDKEHRSRLCMES